MEQQDLQTEAPTRHSTPGLDEAGELTCAICLHTPEPVDLAVVKGCEHLYCVHCILKWAMTRGDSPWCPQCKAPFDSIYAHRLLDGTVVDFPVEDCVTLLLRAKWFQAHLEVEERGHLRACAGDADPGGDWWYEDEEHDEDDELERFYFSSAAGRARVVIGNRRFGEHGVVRAGRMYARPVPAQQQQQAQTPSAGIGKAGKRGPKGSAAAAGDVGAGSSAAAGCGGGAGASGSEGAGPSVRQGAGLPEAPAGASSGGSSSSLAVPGELATPRATPVSARDAEAALAALELTMPQQEQQQQQRRRQGSGQGPLGPAIGSSAATPSGSAGGGRAPGSSSGGGKQGRRAKRNARRAAADAAAALDDDGDDYYGDYYGDY